MDYESSDILGSNSPLVRAPPPSQTRRWTPIVVWIIVLAAAYVAAVYAWDALLKWREKSYRLTMRRRHGIPDSDHRPFNVAHAAVLRARREQEVAENRVHRVDVDQLYEESDRRQQATSESDMRQRKNIFLNPEPVWTNPGPTAVPGRFNPLVVENRFASSSNTPVSSPFATNFAERYNPNPPPPPVVRFADPVQPPSRRSSLFINSSPRKHQKRTLDENDVEADVPENPKKTRVEGDEFIDGDEEAEWVSNQGKRGEKRNLRDDDIDDADQNEDDSPNPRVRGKRARKQSLLNEDVLMTSDEDASDMDVDEKAPAAVRGRKRDAVSSFGPEDEVDELDVQKSKRKRRSRKSDIVPQPAARGQKRDRDLEEDGSDGETGRPRTERKTKKRGKKGKEADEETSSVEDSGVRARRNIGEEWESNGVRYKIGPNGRLRQALVKKAARRFIMPLDSQHPDKNANLEVCIETWLTEDEYQDFKTRHLLAWQDSPKSTQEPETAPSTPSAEVPSTPTPTVPRGKDLLWDSPASPVPSYMPSPAEKETGRYKSHFRQTIAGDLGTIRVNPFEKGNALLVTAQAPKNGSRLGRRIGAERETNGLADSTNSGIRPKTFSKWEKQNLEAQAMMKIREVNQAKQKEKELKEKLEKEKEKAAAIPTLTLTAPSAEPSKAATSTSGFSFGSAPTTTTTTPTPTATTSSEASKSLFGPTPASTAPTAAASDKPPQAITTSLFPPASTNPFAKPAASPTASTPAPAVTSASAASPAVTPASPFSFGSTAPAKAPEPAAAAKPSAFSFGSTAPTSQPTPASQPQPASNSLLSRLGGEVAPKPAEPPKSSSSPFFNKPTEPAPAPAQSTTPMFSFTKPGDSAKSSFSAPQTTATAPATTPTPMFSFNTATKAPTPASAKPAEAPVTTTTPMFSFTKPAEPAAAAKPAFPTSTPATSSSSPFSFAKPATEPTKSAFTAPAPSQGSAFSFVKPAEPAKAASPFGVQAAATPTATATQTPVDGAPKFNFGFTKPAATPVQPTSSLTGALGSDSAAQPPSQAKPAFSFGTPKTEDKPASTTPAGTPSFAFPAAKPEEKKSAFGSTTTTNSPFSFGNPTTTTSSSSPFSAPATTTSTSSTSPFGAPAAATTATGPSSATATKTAFSFGTPSATPAATPATTATPASSAPAFSFGAPKADVASTTPAGSPATTSNIFGTKPVGAPSVFGAPKPETTAGNAAPAFGFGTNTAGSSVFGSKAASPSPFGAATNATSTTTPVFGANTGSSIFGAKPADSTSTTPFGAAAAAAGPSAFGFGQPQK
ncbi:hypothetical protein MIND_00769900 [Mycena indigotica]|uniref:Uncharacterized protein n=1 Tax=Mycena indigotica TaxID=2126181 RepID=A0A8H6SQC3_9AGAR|nr:uncharacterized protein MIND_00769900 [Mycena indigotica]KAF7302035.1 hypothetical protein MIND_00769900 [Mycena indigotica]